MEMCVDPCTVSLFEVLYRNRTFSTMTDGAKTKAVTYKRNQQTNKQTPQQTNKNHTD